MGKVWEFELGEEVQEIVTGLKGVVMCRAEYITGCDRYGIQPRGLTKEGKESDWSHYDGARLKRTGKKLSLPKTEQPRKPGGPARPSEFPQRR